MADDSKVGPQGDGQVGVKLAHPLNVRDLVNLGLDPDTSANVGDVIVVTAPQASSLIGAGFVQVDPDDRVEVTRVLEGEQASEDVMPSATSGNTGTTKLTGDALEDALRKRGLPSDGSADEKRAAVAKFDAEQTAGR